MTEGSRPKVAVLLSTYNGARHLSEQIGSLQRQVGVEVLLHARDDGSKDDTVAVLRSHASEFPALADVGPGENLGVARSFLELLRTAPGEAEYFAFCDQDDVWLDDKLTRATGALSQVEGPAMYCSLATLVDENLEVIGPSPAHAKRSFEQLLFTNFAIGCTIVMNRAARELVIRRLPEIPIPLHDWWVTQVIAAFGTIVYDPKPGLLYRQHGGNVVGMTGNRAAERWMLARRLISSPRSFYSIHAQAAEFQRLFGADLTGEKAAALDELVESKRSFARQLAFAARADVPYHDPLGRLACKALIAMGWY